jgi:peptide/nickel transport system substrate-binding protein
MGRGRTGSMALLLLLLVIVEGLVLARTEAAPQPSGELIFAWGTLGSEALDPTLGPVSGIKLHGVLLYDSLIGATPQGEFSKETGLATDWEITHTASKSVYTLTLRQGVKFHNGDEFTAHDVKFTIEYFMREKSVSSGASFFRGTVDRVEVLDTYKVEIHTKSPSLLLFYYLSPIMFAESFMLPKKYIEEHGEEYFNLHPVGTGPYRFKEQVVGSHMTFEAVPNHWRLGVPKFKTVTFKLVPEETTRVGMLRRGEADVADVSRERIGEVEAAGLKLFSKPGGEVVMGWMSNTWQEDTYLHDERVRLALNLAIDRQSIVDSLLAGQATVVGHGYFGSWAEGYQKLPLYPYDPQRARQLLNEAFPKGVTITFNTFPRPGIPEILRINEAIASMWEAVGVKVNLVPMVDYTVHRPKMIAQELPNTVNTFSTSNQAIWIGGWRFLFMSTGTAGFIHDPELDRLIKAFIDEVELDRFGERQQAVARYIREHSVDIALFELSPLYAGKPDKVPAWDLGRLFWDLNMRDIVSRR